MDDTTIELQDLEHVLSDASAEPIKLSYGRLKFVTKNFSNEIGRGRFGVVYMGYLGNGKVAVKELSNLHVLLDKQFLDAITCLTKAKHKNIVRFLGYCSETQKELVEIDGRDVMKEVQKKLLCFEYVPNGNIRHYLQQDKSHGDDWPARYQMIRGICHGLHYLHDEEISQFGLKPENVMLDAQMEPKIRNFCSLYQGQYIVSTQIRDLERDFSSGAPDFFFEEETSDIYALGSIIKVLLARNRMLNVPNWDEFMDEDCLRALKCTKIAQSCMDHEQHKRPTIHEIVRDLDELESMINQLPTPKLDLQIYVGTTFAVMAAYALLLMISIRYIKVVVIPAIILVFIGALWGKLWFKGRQHRNKRKANQERGNTKVNWLLPMVLLSYCLQLTQLACAQATNGQQSGNFVLSHFLLFFSSTLGALAVMMTAVRFRACRGVVQARRALHMTFTVILVIAVHTMATEWMEEDMLVVCMPGLIAALVWFTVHFDHGGCTISVDEVTSGKSMVIVLTAAAVPLVAYKLVYENDIVLANYWYTRILCSCTLSGFLSCFSMWMIRQLWPEIIPLLESLRINDSAMVPLRVLNFSAMICFSISAIVFFSGFFLNQ